MGWSGGTDVIEGIAQAVNLCNLQGNESLFWSIIVDTLENADWDNLNEAVGLNDDLDRIIALRSLQYTIDHDLPGFEEELRINRTYLTDGDMQILESIKNNSSKASIKGD